jgi:hypothetical protein
MSAARCCSSVVEISHPSRQLLSFFWNKKEKLDFMTPPMLSRYHDSSSIVSASQTGESEMKITQIAYGECADSDKSTGSLFALTDEGDVFMLLDPWNPESAWKELKPLNDETKPNIKAKAKV